MQGGRKCHGEKSWSGCCRQLERSSRTSPARFCRRIGRKVPQIHIRESISIIAADRMNHSIEAIRRCSPIDGVAENAGAGSFGRITISDGDGHRNEILHTHSQIVKVGDRVVAGQPIGTMGNMGVDKKGVELGHHHVHYQLLDRSTGFRLSPPGFWDSQDPAIRANREALALSGEQASQCGQSIRQPRAGGKRRHRSCGRKRISRAPPDAKPQKRYLGRRIAGQPEPTLPYSPTSFDDRFEN